MEGTDEATDVPLNAVHSLLGTWKPQRGVLRGMDLRLGVDDLTNRTFRRHLASLDAKGRSFL